YGRRSKVLKKIGNRSFECIFSRSSKENRLSWRIYKVTSSILGVIGLVTEKLRQVGVNPFFMFEKP
ncbi:hypothetical protein, partial [Paenibacillus aquistagni]|uniref:hypothetical protein n=2 Tax=Paenibacillus aquistagni TaxID=1852522 RepID=UPI001C6FC9E2